MVSTRVSSYLESGGNRLRLAPFLAVRPTHKMGVRDLAIRRTRNRIHGAIVCLVYFLMYGIIIASSCQVVYTEIHYLRVSTLLIEERDLL